MIWIMVAHRADARLFSATGRPGEIRLIREFDHPEGRKQNKEIDSDAKGSHYSTTGRGNAMHGSFPSHQMKHGFDPEMEAAEHVSDVFAKELAVTLRDGRTHGEFNELIVIAEASFLGKIRKFLDKECARMVTTSLNRNLTAVPVHELVKHLDGIIHSTRKVA